MKKIISVVLAVVMLFAVASPSMTVFAAGEKYITIYVEGYSHSLYKNNVASAENKIYDIEVDIGAILSEVLMPCLEKLALGLLTDDYDDYCDELYNAVAPIYEELRLDPSGEVLDGSGWGGDMLKDGYRINYNQRYSGGKVTFQYDWRLSPIANARILEQFIDRVCTEQKVEKVNLLGRCLGGNIINSYLEKGNNLDKINKIIMYIPSTMGLSTIGAIFSGNIVIQDKAVDNVVTSLIYDKELITDPTMQSLITSTVSLLEYAQALGLGIDALMTIVDNVKDNVIPRLVRDTYGSFTSFWAMCPLEYVNEAVEFCYGTKELKAEYAGTIEKIYDYKQVQENAYETMKSVKASGIDIMVVSKYNLPNLPFSEDGLEQSDALAETYRTSFGSTSPEFGKTFSEEYINNMSQQDKRFLSPDLKMDASTCLFPEKTWFIKNSTHGLFPHSVDYLMDAFLCNDDFTVFSSEEYPQFMQLDKNEDRIYPVTEPDEEAPEEGSGEERFLVFIRFFTAILNFFAKLLRGELDFSFNLNL